MAAHDEGIRALRLGPGARLLGGYTALLAAGSVAFLAVVGVEASPTMPLSCAASPMPVT